MAHAKEMPAAEKYARVMDAIEQDDRLSIFIEEQLGSDAYAEYQKIRDSGLRPIPEGASPEEKYELAFSNWMWIGSTSFGYVRDRMGQDGLARMVDRAVAEAKRANSSPGLYFLALIRAISPGRAFEMLVKRSIYELQWLSPYSVEEMSRQRLVMTIPHCKLLDYPNADDVCLIGCQQIYPRWFAEQLKVKMDFTRQGNSCTARVTPLN